MDLLLKEFYDVFSDNGKEVRTFFSPGRVNLIGEHTDYNGGYVFPAGLDVGTTVLIRKRDDNKVLLYATDLKNVVEASLNDIENYKDIKWGNYQLGVIYELIKAGYNVGGCEMLFCDTVPHGAGLSSSAAIECATGLAVYSMFNDKPIDKIELAFIGQKAENRYIGVNCGIMDQFASSMARKDHGLFLNTRTMEYKYVPLKLGDYRILISNTNKKRGLANSKYNERRSQCEEGLQAFKKVLDVKCLGEVSVEDFEEHKHLIEDDIVRKRVEHVIYEDERVLKSMDVLNKGDLRAFGRLMTQSHESLRDLYEVTGVELDTLAEEALKIDGVLGSRMTGAGFGGCTVTIIHKESIEEFKRKVGENYTERTGLKADFYVFEVGDGVREIK